MKQGMPHADLDLQWETANGQSGLLIHRCILVWEELLQVGWDNLYEVKPQKLVPMPLEPFLVTVVLRGYRNAMG